MSLHAFMLAIDKMTAEALTAKIAAISDASVRLV
jgi:hypothetical protein